MKIGRSVEVVCSTDINMEENRLAVIGITVNHRENTAVEVQSVLTEFGDIIVGRMGVQCKERGVSVISLIVDGSNDDIGALSGRLGNLTDVKAKVSTMV